MWKRRYTRVTIALLVVFVLWMTTALAQPSYEWVRHYDGPISGLDEAKALCLDASGNVIVTGRSWGSGTNWDYATLKYDAAGNWQWTRRYDYEAVMGIDEAFDVQTDGAGNVYVTGRSDGGATGQDYLTVKYSSAGVWQWYGVYDHPVVHGDDEACALQVDEDGNAYVTGKSMGNSGDWDYATVKYNAVGSWMWISWYNNDLVNGADEAAAMVIDGDGNAYVTGRSEGSTTGYDYATVKYNNVGEWMWINRYDNAGASTFDEASAITVDAAGSVYVTGRSAGSGTNYDYATVKYNALGDWMWISRYNNDLVNGPDEATAIAVDDAGHVYVTGRSQGNGTNYDYVTIRYNASTGAWAWIRRYNSGGNVADEALALELDNFGNVYVTGTSAGDCVTLVYDQFGNHLEEYQYDGPGSGTDQGADLKIDDAGNLFVTGFCYGSGTTRDYLTIKYASDCDCPYQSDFDEDGFITALDLASEIDALFSGGPDPTDPGCPTSRGDFDNDGFNTALDLAGLIDHLFSGDDRPCDPCNPVQSTCTP